MPSSTIDQLLKSPYGIVTETFQWFLDDGIRDDYCIDDTLKVMKNPKKFFKHYFKPFSKKPSALDLSIHGFQRFVDFCIEFAHFLQESAPYPLLQSAMWHFFCYWFEQIGEKVDEEVVEAAESFLSWSPEQDPKEAKKEVDQYVRRVKWAMGTLTNGDFGVPLRRLAAGF
jgi:hypothetical protein